jgi:hypothetical protein
MGLLPVATAYPLMSNVDVILHAGRRQRTYAYFIQFTTVTCINIPMLRILFFSITWKMTHHRHHKCDLKLHYHPFIYGTVRCAAGMLMCLHSSSRNEILKMQDLVTKANKNWTYFLLKKKINNNNNNNKLKKPPSQAHNMCQQCFMFITLSPVSQLSHHAPLINTHILHT